MSVSSKIVYYLYFTILSISFIAFLAFLFKPSIYETLTYKGPLHNYSTEEFVNVYLVVDSSVKEDDLVMANRSLARVKGSTEDYKVEYSLLSDFERNEFLSTVSIENNLDIEEIKYPAVAVVSESGKLVGFYQEGVPTEYLSYLIPKIAEPLE